MYAVRMVAITNRLDCCSDRQNNLIVGLTNKFQGSVDEDDDNDDAKKTSGSRDKSKIRRNKNLNRRARQRSHDKDSGSHDRNNLKSKTNRRGRCRAKTAGERKQEESRERVKRGTYALCGRYIGTAAGKPRLEVQCLDSAPPGRYVIIQQPADGNGFLNFCEIEVFGEEPTAADLELLKMGQEKENLALGKPTFHSSTYPQGDPKKAVDGNTDSNWGSGSCASTADGPGGSNWFIVDILNNYFVKRVVISNRMDCCSDRMSNVAIGVMKVYKKLTKIKRGSYPLCSTIGSATGVETITIACDAATPSGRYVILQQPKTGPGYLNFCEIEVYGKLDSVYAKVEENTLETTASLKSSRPSKCPKDFDYIKSTNRCYKLISDRNDWETHRNLCNQLNQASHLVMPKSKIDQDDLNAYLNGYDDVINAKCTSKNPRFTLLWTAGQRLGSNGSKFVWKPFKGFTEEFPSNFNAWFYPQPDNALGFEACMHLWKMDKGYFWNDAACGKTANVAYNNIYKDGASYMCAICEIDLR